MWSLWIIMCKIANKLKWIHAYDGDLNLIHFNKDNY